VPPNDPAAAALDPTSAVEGWFATDPEPHLIGTRCAVCGTFAFPPESFFCRNPRCDSTSHPPTPLSRRGRVWSFVVNHYAAPPPALSSDPFEPYAVAAVSLDDEHMVVLGRVADGTDLSALRVGQMMEVAVEPIIAGADELVWKWKPVGS
jgi:uncharacterized OB-fold protein